MIMNVNFLQKCNCSSVPMINDYPNTELSFHSCVLFVSLPSLTSFLSLSPDIIIVCVLSSPIYTCTHSRDVTHDAMMTVWVSETASDRKLKTK